jgi:CubicO group peptidase (beta-lactamase class C family)
MLDALDESIDRALAEQRIVGAVILISRDGELICCRSAGLADREADIPMREHALFRLASLSKPIVSAAALALVDCGQLHLDDAVTKWIPEFQPALADGSKPALTLRHLLSHTAGLTYGFLEPDDGPYHQANVSDGLDQPGLSMEENLRRIASVPLAYQPGTAWSYSIATDIAGEMVARASDRPLPEAVRRLVTGPLGMTDTDFVATDASRLAVPYADGSPRPVRMGEVALVKAATGPGFIRFEPARAFHPDSYPSGGCGMVGSAADFRHFLEALRSGGSPILSAESARAMTSNQTGGLGPRPGVAYGFGMSVIVDSAVAQTPQSPGTFAWGGVYGHSWFVDRAMGLSVVTLTNTAIEGTSGKFAMDVRNAVYSD